MTMEYEEVEDKNAILRELMQKYGEDVRNFAFTLSKRIDVADDITQEVFIKVYRNLDSFRGDSTIKTWLLAITRRVAFDFRRSAFFRRVILQDCLLDSGSIPSAEEEALSKMNMDYVWQSALTLPTNLREVLVLHVHHHLSYSEVAMMLGISESAVKGRIHRARAKITSRLREGEESEL